jgi:DNA-binding transcriptional ArsR family regulator
MLNYSDIGESLRALADPTRGAIVDRLLRGPATVSMLAEPFPMTMAAIVQHLQVLESAGLIASQKIGRVRTCRLEPKGFAPLATYVEQRRALVERRLDRLGAYLATTDEAKPKRRRK